MFLQQKKWHFKKRNQIANSEIRIKSYKHRKRHVNPLLPLPRLTLLLFSISETCKCETQVGEGDVFANGITQVGERSVGRVRI